MAISNITITQNNIVGSSDLIPVHSPVIFIADCTYSGAIPTYLLVDVIDSASVLLATYRAIPYRDSSLTVRQFMFIADEILRSYMASFDDVAQSDNTLIHIPNQQKIFTIKFKDPANFTTNDSDTITAIHGSGQFGENPNFNTVYANATGSYIAGANKQAYVYFYNNNASNVLTITVA